MADGVNLLDGSGSAFEAASDDCGASGHTQLVKLAISANGDATLIPADATDGLYVNVRNSTIAVTDNSGSLTVDDGGTTLSVDDGAGSLTVDNAALAVTGGGVEASALRVTLASDSTGVVSVDDNGSSLTVDNAALSVTGGGVEASALRVTLASDSTGVLSIDDNAGSLTVDAPLGTPVNVQVGDGTTAADVIDLATRDALAVAIVDGSGDQLTSFGGGTQYTEGATDATITGTAILWEDTGDALAVASAAKPLPVEVIAGATSGTEYTEGDTDATITGTAALMEGAANALVPLQGTASDGLLVNLGSNNDVTNTTLSVVGGGAEATALRVTLASDSTGVVSVDDNGASLTVDNAALSVTGGGVEATALRVTIANDSTGVVSVDDNGSSLTVDNGGTFAVQDSQVIADDAAFTVATSKVFAAGFLADESSTDSVDEGDAGAARMTLDRRQIVVPQGYASGGLTIFRSLDLDESEEEVKASAGAVYGWAITNLATSTRFVKFYNATAANVTVGTTTPVMTVAIPGNSSDDVTANMLGGVGIGFATAITVAATTGIADNDTGAPGANEVLVNLFYA